MKEWKKRKKEGKYMIWFYGTSTIVGYLMPNPLYTLLWGHILPYTKDRLVQPKHVLWVSSPAEDSFSFLTRYLTDRLQAENG